MKKVYNTPSAIQLEDFAEGIYAASGDIKPPTDDDKSNPTPEPTPTAAPSQPIDYDNDPDCWTVGVSKTQVVAHEGYANFRVQADHPDSVKHISEQSVVTVTFNQPITGGSFENFGFEVNGCTVTLTRIQHGNSYNSADQYNSLLKVYCDNPDTLEVIDYGITCKHIPNVQGDFD